MHAVAAGKLAELLMGGEQRFQVLGNHGFARRLFQPVEQPLEGIFRGGVPGVLRRARRDGIGRKRREMGVPVVQPQRLLEALLQALEEIQRPAKEQHVALDFAPLRQPGQRLVDHRLEN